MNGKRRMVMALCCLLAGMFVVVSLSAAQGREEQNAQDGRKQDRVIAVIGDEQIHFSEVEKIAQGLNRFLKENFQTSKAWRLDFARKYIARRALAKRARREGLDKDKDVLFMLGQAKEDILSNTVLSRELAKINITEDDLREYYRRNKAKYQIKEQVKLSYAKFSARKAAEKIIGKINKGRTFKKAAGKRAVKIEQWISREAMFIPNLEQLSPEQIKTLFGLGLGGTSEVIELSKGGGGGQDSKAGEGKGNSSPGQVEYIIFHIDEKKPAEDRPFKDIRRQIEAEYTRKVKSDLVDKLIRETFRQEKVEIYQDKISEGM